MGQISGTGENSPIEIGSEKEDEMFRMNEGENFSTFENYGIIPTRCLHDIFLFFDLEDIFNVLLACKLFNRVGNTHLFWKEYFRNICGEEVLKMHDDKSNQLEDNELKLPKNATNQKRNYKKLCFEYISVYFRYKRKDDHFKPVFSVPPINNSQGFDFGFKLLIVGDENVGKSNFLLRLCDDKFIEEYVTTIGVDFKVRRVPYKNKTCKICVWDTSGKERFRQITNSYYRGAHGIMIAFSLTDEKSFQNVKFWYKEIAEYGSEGTPIIICGMKKDLEKERKVDKKMVLDMFRKLNLIGNESVGYCECSSLKKLYMNYPFGFLVKRCYIKNYHQY